MVVFTEKYYFAHNALILISGGLVVRASTSGAETLVWFQVGSNQSLKLVFTASLLDAHHERDSVENKPEVGCCAFGKGT